MSNSEYMTVRFARKGTSSPEKMYITRPLDGDKLHQGLCDVGLIEYEILTISPERELSPYKWGFDLTDFGDDWPAFKEKHGLVFCGNENNRAIFKNPYTGITLFCGCNPDTGEYLGVGVRGIEPGYLSYVGIEGTNAFFFLEFIESFKTACQFTKSESPLKRAFI